MTYTCRYGRHPARTTAVGSYNALLGLFEHEGLDDGREVDAGAAPWPAMTCPDCERGPVVWAEAGYVPGHRVCPYCGAHWTLESNDAGRCILRRARFYGGDA